MTKLRQTTILFGLLLFTVLIFFTSCWSSDNNNDSEKWTTTFNVEKKHLKDEGKNPYFILEPGYCLLLEGKEGNTKVELVITVLKETEVVDGLSTRVVEEREFHNGELVEVSRNYFTIDKVTNSVFYFGEDVDIYKNGKVVSHEGAWQSGKNGARFGLMMPGIALLGSRYYQEIAPEVAMDRAEIISIDETLKTQAGKFQRCLRIEETTPLEPGVKEYKLYFSGIGLVKDGALKLVDYGFLKKQAGGHK